MTAEPAEDADGSVLLVIEVCDEPISVEDVCSVAAALLVPFGLELDVEEVVEDRSLLMEETRSDEEIVEDAADSEDVRSAELLAGAKPLGVSCEELELDGEAVLENDEEVLDGDCEVLLSVDAALEDGEELLVVVVLVVVIVGLGVIVVVVVVGRALLDDVVPSPVNRMA